MMAVREISKEMLQVAFRFGTRTVVHQGLVQVDARVSGADVGVIARPIKRGFHIVTVHLVDS